MAPRVLTPAMRLGPYLPAAAAIAALALACTGKTSVEDDTPWAEAEDFAQELAAKPNTRSPAAAIASEQLASLVKQTRGDLRHNYCEAHELGPFAPECERERVSCTQNSECVFVPKDFASSSEAPRLRVCTSSDAINRRSFEWRKAQLGPSAEQWTPMRLCKGYEHIYDVACVNQRCALGPFRPKRGRSIDMNHLPGDPFG